MFQVTLHQMGLAIEDMQLQLKQLDDVIAEVQSIKKSLQAMSGMEGAVSMLENQIRELEESRFLLYQLLQALNKIAVIYDRCEQKIIENSLQVRSSINYSTGYVDVTSIADQLSQFYIE